MFEERSVLRTSTKQRALALYFAVPRPAKYSKYGPGAVGSRLKAILLGTFEFQLLLP